MTSQVLMNITTDPFQQVNKKTTNVSTVSKFDGFSIISTDPASRIHQLEQNIKFLQDQHQLMLSGLHQEIEHLRRWNRDLQFKLVFCKGGVALLQSSPSSPEDDQAQHKILLSPNQVNITPLQIEILERDVAELKTNLSEARTRNVYLQNIVDEQKKKLASLELAATSRKNSDGKENIGKGKQVVNRQDSLEELQEKMEEAERLIRRLRRENEEQRKEIMSLRTSVSKSMSESRREGHRGYYRNQQQSNHSRFPPLQTHNQYNNHGIKSCDYRNPEKDGISNGLEKDSQVIGKPAPTLPHLRDRNNATTSTGYSNPTYTNYQGGNSNHRKYYHRKQQDDGERYRGGGGGRGIRGNHRSQQE